MKDKRLLAIAGSPHKNGVTSKMLECTVEAAQNNGWKVDRIDLYDKKISYCNGCRSCLITGECVQKDDIREIAALLKKCDTVALAAPVYWANIPAVVKNLFDRLLGTVMEETKAFPKPRLSSKQRFIFLTACNTPFPFSWMCGQSRGAIRSVKEFFKTAGMRCGEIVVCENTAEKKELPGRTVRKIQHYWNVKS